MSSNPIRNILTAVGLLLASVPAAGEESVYPIRSYGTPDSTLSSRIGLEPVPDCPHCRKAGLLSGKSIPARPGPTVPPLRKGPSATIKARPQFPPADDRVARTATPDEEAARHAAKEPDSLDVDVRQVQVPLIPERPRLRIPASTATATASARRPKARVLPPAPTAGPPSPLTNTEDVGPPPMVPVANPSTAPIADGPPHVAPVIVAGGGNVIDMTVPPPTDSTVSGFEGVPVMLGDQPPASLQQTIAAARPPVPRAIVPGQPPTPPAPTLPGRAHNQGQARAVLPWARGFKIADNQSPLPQDRMFYTFDYFNDLNGSVNRRLGSNLGGLQVYRELLGIEKTFLNGNASFGFRLPIDTLWASGGDPSLRRGSTAVDDLTFFTKFLLLGNPLTGNALSAGLAVTTPNGPTGFAGANGVAGFRDTQIQPFLGYLKRRGNFYIQGFTAIDVPTDPADVTLLYKDLAVGYFAYRSADPTAFLTAVVPTFEAHVTSPLNHRGALRPDDPAGTPVIVDLTFGTSVILRERVVASFGCAFPVTGPRPFDIEALALLNIYFGRYGIATPPPR